MCGNFVIFKMLYEMWNKITKGYCRLITNFPVVIMLVTGFISVILTSLGMVYGTAPDMSEPKLGFETRGTELSGRIMTWQSLDDNGRLTQYPSENSTYFKQLRQLSKYAISRKKRSVSRRFKRGEDFFQSLFVNALKNSPCLQLQHPFEEAKWFSHVVFQVDTTESLFQKDIVQELCEFQVAVNKSFDTLRSAIDYPHFWSLPNYYTCLAGEIFCQNLTKLELDQRYAEAKNCSAYRRAILKCNVPNKITPPDQICKTIPETCKSKFYYDMFNVLLSKNAFDEKSTGPVYTTMVLPILQLQSYVFEEYINIGGQNFTPIYNDILELRSTLKHTKIVGLNLGMKMEAFSEAILLDSIFVVLAGVVATAICLSYSGSVFYAAAIALSLIFSVGISFFTYCIVFQINFFPFINLLVIVLLVGIGADNTFVLKHIFDNAELRSVTRTDPVTKKEQTTKIIDLNTALSQAAKSMFITNATTAAAFYANYVSDIIVMKCFGIFAGTTMLINYLLIISWLPASLVILERYINPWFQLHTESKFCIIDRWTNSVRQRGRHLAEIFVERFLYRAIEQLKFLWISGFILTFVGSLLIVFYKPGVALPKRNPLQMFRKSNLFEWYDDHMEDLFYFASFLNETEIEIDIVWGLKPSDIGSVLNPKDTDANRGYFHKDDNFTINLKTLHALDDVCHKLGKSKLILENPTRRCFAEQYLQWAEHQSCSRSFICCNQSSSKFNESLLNQCLLQGSRDLDITDGSPFFSTNKLGEIDGYFMYMTTVFNWSLIYEDLEKFYHAINTEVAQIVKGTNMPEVQNYWWTTTWHQLSLWYDLQHSLLHGTPSSIMISVLVALGVAVISTRTLILSLLSIICICGVISITIASLVLLGWHLNIVESTIIILTGGLAFDFTLLYAAAYKMSKNGFRKEKVMETLMFIGLPVFLSAIVTISCGLCMMPSSTWGYYQVGLFMVLVSIISWLCSTLFFLSLLFLFGPQDTEICNYKRLPCFQDTS